MIKITTTTRIFVITLVLIFAAGLFNFTAFAETDDLEKQQEQINEKIQKTQELLNQTKNQENSALKELKSINNTLYTTSRKLQTTEKNLAITENDLAYLEGELKKSAEHLAANTDILGNRLNTIYEQGNVHILDVLLSSTSFTDFLTRWDLLERLAEQDMGLIAEVKDEIKTTQEKKTQVLVKKETLAALRQDQQERQQELNTASSRQKQIYNSITSERKDVEKALNELAAESARIGEELRKRNGGSAYLGSGKLAWPTPGYTRITSPFGMRIHPILKERRMHTGIDIGAPMGAAIVAAEQGEVIDTGYRGAYGNIVMIDHGGGIVTMYAHNSKILVKVGQYVKKGQKVSQAGSTGWATGPHLHFEVRKNGDPVNPMNYLK